MSPHGGNIWELCRRRGFDPPEVLDVSADLNPLGPPPGWEGRLAEGLKSLRWYPDPDYLDFRRAAACLHGLEPECILPGNGTAELIHLAAGASRFRRAVVAVPTFTEYERALAGRGKPISLWPLQAPGFRPPSLPSDFSGCESGLIFLCNPNNPTGTLWPRESLVELLAAAGKHQATVVVDEAYLDFVPDPGRYSMAGQVKHFKNLIVLRSLTKSFALPGLRIGYLAAEPGMAAALAQEQPPWSLNALAAGLGPWLLEQSGHLAESRRELTKLRLELLEDLRSVPGLRIHPSEANFFLCELTDPELSTREIRQALEGQGILIRTCDDFTGLTPGRFFRVAVKPRRENERLITAMKGLFAHAN
ncbi:MAG: threonine-phosphate decarboxylase [Candidatus Omnitrophica bacterium]|nr:threonine-phosphate decarboxylase [Candidatus Omnitrophota bacterium]